MAATVSQTSKAQPWVDGAIPTQGNMFLPLLISMSALPTRMATLWYSGLKSPQIVKQLMANVLRFFFLVESKVRTISYIFMIQTDHH